MLALIPISRFTSLFLCYYNFLSLSLSLSLSLRLHLSISFSLFPLVFLNLSLSLSLPLWNLSPSLYMYFFTFHPFILPSGPFIHPSMLIHSLSLLVSTSLSLKQFIIYFRRHPQYSRGGKGNCLRR